jgi:hypothetical protein
MTERTTYGELMDQAARRMGEASPLVATQPLLDRATHSARSLRTAASWRRCGGTAGNYSAATTASSVPSPG